MFRRFAIILSVAFLFVGTGFWGSPAYADWNVGIGNVTGNCVQFDWRGGTATYSGSGTGDFSVDVNNTIDNTIGGGSTPDSWSIWVNHDQIVSSNVIEQSRVVIPVSGDWVVTVQGIDNGFWAGWYGTMFCNASFGGNVAPVVEPVVVPEPVVVSDPPYVPAPQPVGDYRLNEGWGAHIVAPTGMVIDTVTAWYGDPNDGNRGADESVNYTRDLHGLVEADLNSGNYYGDPLPGVYKVLVASVTFVIDATYIAPIIQPAPSPEPTQPPSEPVSVDARTVDVREELIPPSEPSVPSEPIVPIQPEPVVVPEPVQLVVRPEPIVEPTPEPVVEPTPEPIPQPVTPPVEPVAEPEPVIVPEPVIEPVVEPIVKPIVAPVQPTDTPKTTITPETPAPVQPQVKLDTTPSPTQELQQLADAAKQDDVEVPAEIANIPILGGAAVAIVDTFNALGNLGADMRPKVRATAKKEVITAVIVGQVAQTASMVAGGSAAIRRRNS